MGSRILIIDDEPQIRKILEIGLSARGYSIEEAENGVEGLSKIESWSPDLVLLDLGLPDLNGRQVLRRIRANFDMPVIIISAQGNVEEMLAAVSEGADDYFSKPFRMQDVIEKIGIILTFKPQRSLILSVGQLMIDESSSLVTTHGNTIALTSTEYLLLLFFVRNQGRLLTIDRLLKVFANHHEFNSQHLRLVIQQLRSKIEEDANRPKYIVNESNIGYRFLGQSL